MSFWRSHKDDADNMIATYVSYTDMVCLGKENLFILLAGINHLKYPLHLARSISILKCPGLSMALAKPDLSLLII